MASVARGEEGGANTGPWARTLRGWDEPQTTERTAGILRGFGMLRTPGRVTGSLEWAGMAGAKFVGVRDWTPGEEALVIGHCATGSPVGEALLFEHKGRGVVMLVWGGEGPGFGTLRASG